MKILITWWAWFVASNMTKVLLDRWDNIVSIDNFVLWKREYIKDFLENKNYKFIEEDLMNLDRIIPFFKDIDLVVHLAANSDISKWANITNIDLNIWTVATYNVLEAMRLNNVKKIIFSSSSANYWLAKKLPIQEDYGPLFPISLYWASKLACEWLISAFCHNYWITSWIYRFGNVIGRNATHGAAFDFVNRLKKDPNKLLILWNWKQAKPYIYVDDLINWMIYWFKNSNDEINYFNLSTSSKSSVNYIAECIIKHMWLEKVKLEYTGWEQWWKWDVPQVELDPTKLNNIWWFPKYSSEQAVWEWTKDIVDQIYFWKNI
ncbi:MAG: hypothetical protein ACD_49C00060G0032 [uncultured bacterium (gcode 4)]|uniref:NAD-dependent epimerase/dehydratase domain-containing protein n=1 Tax=uncultured bacterium (gcode 4) TaxID=1234023 RepID=K2ADT5_9BACT|nr:MAG: hypothetical protein ACD_49C00060G0032 [uncultured bacterium (gcode 4)]